MIYMLSVSEIAPGKVAEWEKIASNELMPLFPKVGMKLVASWRGYSGNVNTTYTLFAFNDMAALQKTSEAQRQSADYQRVSAEMNALRVAQTRTILEPNAWSPMK